MSGEMLNDLVAKNNAFSAATLIYTRLRRVTGRVVDAAYLAENIEYAQYVDAIIEISADEELLKHIKKLKNALGIVTEIDRSEHLSEKNLAADLYKDELKPSYQATEEEVYKAQVSHHYIGSLR